MKINNDVLQIIINSPQSHKTDKDISYNKKWWLNVNFEQL